MRFLTMYSIVSGGTPVIKSTRLVKLQMVGKFDQMNSLTLVHFFSYHFGTGGAMLVAHTIQHSYNNPPTVKPPVGLRHETLTIQIAVPILFRTFLARCLMVPSPPWRKLGGSSPSNANNPSLGNVRERARVNTTLR